MSHAHPYVAGEDESSFYGIIGKSSRMQEVYKKISKVAPEDVTVLILGESGTGKELVAGAIHRLSPRCEGPLIAVNMGAMATEIAASEIFGHEKGAFTGATDARSGMFSAANDGTLFLDEVGSMDHKAQTSLLRILENRLYTKVGGTKTHTTNARIIAANDTDLRLALKENKFRRDLLYRLEVFVIHMPPLRERWEDIPLLGKYFQNRFNQTMQKEPVAGITEEALKCLMRYRWPGNVRELKNVMQSAMLLAETDTITLQDLPPRVSGQTDIHAQSIIRPHMSLKEVEKIYISQTLHLKNGNKSETAKTLGVSRRYLYNKIEQYNINGDGRRLKNA